MSDLIDRQAAIDAMLNMDVEHRVSWLDAVIDTLDELPSAQPEREVYSNMSDKEFEKWLYEHGICHPDINEPISCKAVPLLIDSAINELPSAQPERKTGRWEKQRETYCSWECSVCKEIVVAMPERMGYPMYDYCPNCGARMENK